MLAPSQTESVIVVYELTGAQYRLGHPLPEWSPWQLECQQIWAKMQSSALAGTLAKVEVFADFFATGGVCCSVNSGRLVFGLTGGPKHAVMGALS